MKKAEALIDGIHPDFMLLEALIDESQLTQYNFCRKTTILRVLQTLRSHYMQNR